MHLRGQPWVNTTNLTRGKSWFLLCLGVSLFVPSIYGLVIALLGMGLMIILAKVHKFKAMDMMLNVVITGLASSIIRLLLI